MRSTVLLLAIPFALSMTLAGSGQVNQQRPPDDPTTSAQSVSVGYWHRCAITDEQRVRCWGDGHWGELGNGTREDWNQPAAVVGLSGISSQVVAADRYTCALDESGSVMCWGNNAAGMLGVGSHRNKGLRPASVIGLTGPVAALSGLRTHMCALYRDGGVACWGDNSAGQLGPSAGGWHSRLPVAIDLPRPADSVSAGEDMTCAVLDDATLWCWGGQAGRQPTQVYDQVSQVSVGSGYACLVTVTGSAKCWGVNYFGSLGDGTTHNRGEPVQVKGLDHGVAQVEAGSGVTCALLDDDTVRCWGMTGLSEGGDPVFVTPAVVNGLGPVDFLDVGLQGACAITASGETRCWDVRFDPIVAVTVPNLEGHARVVRRTDVLLGERGVSPFIGNDVYNANGLDQTGEITAHSGDTVRFTARVQNDGAQSDIVFIAAKTPRQTLARTRFYVGGHNVTRAVRYGSYWRELAPGETCPVVMVLTVKRDVASLSRLALLLSGRSAHDHDVLDRAQAVVQVVRSR